MKKTVAALAVALAASVGLNAYHQLPSGKPSTPVYAQRVVQLLEDSNRGDWAGACDAAPTAAYSYSDFTTLAVEYGIVNVSQIPKFCESLIRGAASKDGKHPLGLTYEVLWYTPKDVKGEKLVVVNLKWNGQVARTVTFHMALIRLPWGKATARCGKDGKTACAPLRWYVLGAT